MENKGKKGECVIRNSVLSGVSPRAESTARTLPAAAVPGVSFVAAALEVLGIVRHRTAELDAWYARAYGPSRDELRGFGEYRIRRLVLEAWGQLEKGNLHASQDRKTEYVL